MARTQYVQCISIPQDAIWHIKIKCTYCNQNFPKQVTFSKNDEIQLQKQHGSANFSIKCKSCERKGYIKVDDNSSYKVEPNEDGIAKEMIAIMECRGIEIYQIMLGNMFTVKVKGSSVKFQNADFTDLWCEYDEEIDKVAQVQDPRIEIIRDK